MNYYQKRTELLAAAANKQHALLIIGGGITGCGIALDAQSRGIPTILLEMRDIASGTSSRSTKLIHGGLRYLKQLEFGIVRETGKERAIIHSIAPHITTPEPMLLPIIKGGSMPKWMASIGTLVYDRLAGVKEKERRKVLDKTFTCQREPLLDPSKTTGGIYYYEYRTDDARLTMAVAKTAMDKGANIITYTKVTKLLYTDGKLKGVQATDTLSGKEYTLYADQIVNASGPWVDTLDGQDPTIRKNKLTLTKGVHIVVDHKKFPIQQAVYFDVGDKRMVFAIPRDGKTYIGTTDTKYTGNIEEPGIEDSDKTYLLNSLQHVFPGVRLTIEDIESYWSGVRPLIREEGKSPSAISRKDEIFESKTGLITIAGGKLTGYRKMAERVTDIVARRFSNQYTLHSCHTATLILSGGNHKELGGRRWYTMQKSSDLAAFGIAEDVISRLIRLYGTKTDVYLKELQHIDARLAAVQLPDWMKAQLQYSVRYELVCKPDDFMIRRTADYYFRRAQLVIDSPEILKGLSILLQWNDAEYRTYAKEWEILLEK